MPLDEAEQKKLRAFVDRRHPEFEQYEAHWAFLESSYEGGRDWFPENIFRYMKEGDTEYEDRVNRAYRFNHTREVVDLVNKYIFASPVTRNEADAPDYLKRFWSKATRSGQGIDNLMRRASQKASTFGRVWFVVDSTMTEAPISKADEKKVDARVFSYLVCPSEAYDMSFDDKGELNWILLGESAREDDDPMTSSGVVRRRFRLWTREKWELYEERFEQRKRTIVRIGGQPHSLRIVPVFALDNIESDKLYAPPALINDIAYLDRAVANYLSNLDAIIQDQTFSQLVMPAQGVLPGEDGYSKLLEMGTKRMFLYDGEAKTGPAYISPDVKQAQLVMAVINKIINEIYNTVGMAGERTKEDNAMGIDNSSGVAKAYDFERMNTLLTNKADALDNAENKLARVVAIWNSAKLDEDKDLVKYPDSFDVRGLYDEFEVAEKLALIQAPDELRREQVRSLVEKLFPRMSDDLKKKIEAEIKKWPPEPEPLTAGPMPASKTPSKQGQNTKGAKTAATAQ